MIKMIAIDLDETFLNDDSNISDYSLSVLEKCRSKGIKIVIATARTERQAERCIKLIKPDISILNCGALVINSSREILYKKELSIETTNAIIEECLNDSTIGDIIAATNEHHYVRKDRTGWHSDFSFWQITDYLKPLTEQTYSILIVTLNNEKAQKIANKFDECATIKFTEGNMFRFLNKEASKIIALKIIAKQEDIKLDEIAAFGDDYSDIEMVKECGMGVAMENGIEEIKKSARFICKTNNEDGVAKFIEHKLLLLSIAPD